MASNLFRRGSETRTETVNDRIAERTRQSEIRNEVAGDHARQQGATPHQQRSIGAGGR